MSEREDIPTHLLTRASQVDPALAAWLETAYPTDAEHAAIQRKRRHQQAQLQLPNVNRAA